MGCFTDRSYVRLCTIYCVKGLVEEESNGPSGVHPWRHILIESWIVPKQGQKVDDDEAEARQCDLSMPPMSE